MNKLKGVDYNQLAFAEMMCEIKELKNLLLKYGYWNKYKNKIQLNYGTKDEFVVDGMTVFPSPQAGSFMMKHMFNKLK